MIEDKELAQLFKAESAEHLSRLDDGLLRLEKTPTDQPLLEEVFRESHSLKGAARMLGLFKIETAAHGLESILNTARKGETPLTPDVIERMTIVLGDLRKLVQEALGGGSPVNAEPAMVGRVSPSGRNPTSNVPAYGNVGLRDEAANPTYASAVMAPSPSQGEGWDGGKNSAKLASSPPTLDHPLPKAEDAPVAGIAPSPPLAEITPSRQAQAAGEPFHIETVRVETRKLDDLLTLVGELSVIDGRAQHRLSLMDALLEQWAMQERSRRKFQSMLRGMKTDVKVSEALHAEGEALAQFGNRLKEARDAFYEDGARLETTVNTLEERVHAVRLLPLSTVFALFPRMVRDLAKQQDKEVELVIEGGEISVDKRILEEMKDPLMHLLRNALDHGIEPPAERERQGKPRGGTVRLRAVRESNGVLLEVRDDGRGLDLEAIRQVALKRGLHDEATLDAMTQAQLQQLIFTPGFSTSTFVTELSGRGVGLDVVRVNVERLKGGIRMESSPRQGSVIQMRLPLSLSTTRLLLASVGNHLYGLPIEFVHTARRVREEDIFTLEGRPAIELDGQPVIAPRLADLLALPDSNPHPDETTGNTVCIVIQVGDERLGLRVDELLDEEEVVAKSLGAPLQRVRNVSGLTILGSGEICAVLNPADLLRSAHQLAAAPVKSKTERVAAATRNAILLVEDSALVRAMEKRILEDAGYEVVVAVDGVDAINALGRRSFAAVVSDINMPNMNGLALTAHIRQEPRYKDLPVILVTTLSSNDDKRRGLDAGANAYIPKPSFDQSVLLGTLQRLIVG
ncbi:MAG: hybrid sensor histidine kinase/response regulator [Gallionella sp.]|nr:hybrid sensor histidine kinase/response regulator [Gallionella sp.]